MHSYPIDEYFPADSTLFEEIHRIVTANAPKLAPPFCRLLPQQPADVTRRKDAMHGLVTGSSIQRCGQHRLRQLSHRQRLLAAQQA